MIAISISTPKIDQSYDTLGESIMDAQLTQKYFRLKLFGSTAVIVLLGAILAGAGIFMTYAPSVGQGYGAIQSDMQAIERILLSRAALMYAAISLLIMAAVIALNILYSHRIAGPAYRLCRESESIGQGNLKGNVRFRRKDNLTDIGESLSQAAFRYKVRVDSLKEHLSFLEAQINSVSNMIEKSRNMPAVERTAAEMEGVLKKMDQVLAGIRT